MKCKLGKQDIHVLRYTCIYCNVYCSSYKRYSYYYYLSLQALDGFILILSSDGEIVFVSEGISESVGLNQQEAIGLSIYELSHEDDASAIKDCLTPDGKRIP